MAPTPFFDECQELFNTTNLYSVLSLDAENTSSLSDKEIKRAYYKASLKYHPDRAQKDETTSEQVELATKRFQLLGKVYSILNDSDKRKIYDESGTVDEDDNGLDDDGRDWTAYWRLLFKKVTLKDIVDFKKKYKDSDEELNDLKVQYLKFEGDMERVYEAAYCADSEEDRDRIRARLQDLIDQDELERFPNFDAKETDTQKKRRLRKAKKEAEEAKQAMKAIMGKEEVSEDELHKAIAKRGADRNASFLQSLEEKYGGGNSKSKKGPAAKKRKAN